MNEPLLGIQHIILPVPTKISKGKLLTPSVHGNWLIGPTAEELEDKSTHNTTPGGLEEEMQDVRKLVPEVTSELAITQYAGLRPVRNPGGYHFRTFRMRFGKPMRRARRSMREWRIRFGRNSVGSNN